MTNGNRYLLDTNYILGLLKSSPRVLEDVSQRGILAHQCAYTGKTHEKPLYDGLCSALPVGANVVI